MAVRNFWLTAEVDGKKEPVATGPRSSDGGMTVKLFVRDNGESRRAVTLECDASADGQLVIRMAGPDGAVIQSFQFAR